MADTFYKCYMTVLLDNQMMLDSSFCSEWILVYMRPNLREPDIMAHTKIFSIKHYKNLVQKHIS